MDKTSNTKVKELLGALLEAFDEEVAAVPDHKPAPDFEYTEEELRTLQKREIRGEQIGIDSKYFDLNFADPSLFFFFRNLTKRIIHLDSAIDSEDSYIIYRILQWNEEDKGIPVNDRKPITIWIDSPGGLLNTTIGICDAIRQSITPVIGINMNEAMSGASAIFASCHYRYAFPHASFLLHLGSGGAVGTYQQNKAQQQHYDHLIEQLKDIYYTSLKLDTPEMREKFDKLIDGEWYLYADVNDGSDHDPRVFNLINLPNIPHFSK